MRQFINFIIIGGLFFLFLSTGKEASLAQEVSHDAYIGHVRTFDPDHIGNLQPDGLAYTPVTQELLALEQPNPTQPTKSSITQITLSEDLANSVAIAMAIEDPINMVFDANASRLLLIDATTNELIEIKTRADGTLNPAALSRSNAQHFGLQNPQGMTIDPQNSHIFIIDATSARLVRIKTKPNQDFDNALISNVELETASLAGARGLAFDPTSGHLHLYTPIDKQLTELTQAGKVVAVRDMSAFDLGVLKGMVFAPSGDQTDDPARMNLFIASNQNGTGTINEFSIHKAKTIDYTAINNIQATLIQTIDSSQWSPPSPDSAGIVYLPANNTLLISDSEVNEMDIFTGDNLYESTLSGILSQTYTTVPWSDEPTGITVNPMNGYLYISDDTGSTSHRGIYELNPGSDGDYGTSDDIVTFVLAVSPSSHDPEGVTFIPAGAAYPNSALFLADGLAEEIYRLTPGNNGIYDGIPPFGDDVVSSFDTTQLGLGDPEGIAYNSDNGNLYIAGKSPNIGSDNFDTLFEVTLGGTLVQTIDVSAANAIKLSGLAYGPSSNNPNGRSVYIVDRGIDNNSDPDENDGKIYEFSLYTPPINEAPIVNAGADQTITLPDGATLNGTVTDDGLPTPPSLTTVWSKTSGPGNVTFVNANSIDTTATFSVAGSYVLRLLADDSDLTEQDFITITVQPEPTAVSPLTTISITNTNDIQLNWPHTLPNTTYEVWRSLTTPYASVEEPNWTMLAELVAPVLEEPMIYTDTAVAPEQTAYYIIKAVIGSSEALSNEIGKFSFLIIAPTAP